MAVYRARAAPTWPPAKARRRQTSLWALLYSFPWLVGARNTILMSAMNLMLPAPASGESAFICERACGRVSHSVVPLRVACT